VHEDPLGGKILQREAKRVKFNGTIVIPNKFTNTTQVLDNRGGDKDVV
jgi:hypothetical protein